MINKAFGIGTEGILKRSNSNDAVSLGGQTELCSGCFDAMVAVSAFMVLFCVIVALLNHSSMAVVNQATAPVLVRVVISILFYLLHPY